MGILSEGFNQCTTVYTGIKRIVVSVTSVYILRDGTNRGALTINSDNPANNTLMLSPRLPTKVDVNDEPKHV